MHIYSNSDKIYLYLLFTERINMKKIVYILCILTITLLSKTTCFASQSSPIFELSRDYQEIITPKECIDIEGKINDYDIFTINNRNVFVESDHTFKYNFSLNEGTNTLNIVATDKAGNTSTYTAYIIRIIPKEKDYTWIKTLVIILLVIVAIIIGFRYSKENEKNKGNDKNTDEQNTAKVNINKYSISTIKDIIFLFYPTIIVFIIFTFCINISVVQSGSMEPTIMTGNTVFINKLYYKFGNEIKRGDVVNFHSDEYDLEFGKRVIGLPNDKIEFNNGHVIINGEYYDESTYLTTVDSTYCNKTFIVPDGCYFMLGDNRANSLDSRYWYNPYIPYKDIKGKYMGQIDFSFQYDLFEKNEHF